MFQFMDVSQDVQSDIECRDSNNNNNNNTLFYSANIQFNGNYFVLEIFIYPVMKLTIILVLSLKCP